MLLILVYYTTATERNPTYRPLSSQSSWYASPSSILLLVPLHSFVCADKTNGNNSH
jgi:hypothetical protein